MIFVIFKIRLLKSNNLLKHNSQKKTTSIPLDFPLEISLYYFYHFLDKLMQLKL